MKSQKESLALLLFNEHGAGNGSFCPLFPLPTTYTSFPFTNTAWADVGCAIKCFYSPISGLGFCAICLDIEGNTFAARIE